MLLSWSPGLSYSQLCAQSPCAYPMGSRSGLRHLIASIGIVRTAPKIHSCPAWQVRPCNSWSAKAPRLYDRYMGVVNSKRPFALSCSFPLLLPARAWYPAHAPLLPQNAEFRKTAYTFCLGRSKQSAAKVLPGHMCHHQTHAERGRRDGAPGQRPRTLTLVPTI